MAVTHVICDPVVIDLLLEPWLDGRGRVVRYYLNEWGTALTEDQVARCLDEHGVRLHVDAKAYFDTEGWLHVDGCPDPDARESIAQWASRWYVGARERLGKTGPRLGWSYPVGKVIGEFARPLSPGFVQLSCGGLSVNLDEEQVARYGSMEARYDPDACRYVADTGYPRLDRILDGLLWELSAPAPPTDLVNLFKSPR
jgi:hypothetical protein